MIPMKMFKKKDGFTLVELIVAIAILAILAGVAIPAYSGYLEKANESKDITTLSAIKTAATAAYATVGEVEKIEVVDSDSGDSVTVTIKGDATTKDADANTDFTDYLGVTSFSITLESKKFEDGTATWDNSSAADAAVKGKWA